jgi:hypothetical protein
LNHGHFFDQERIVYENLTTKKTIKVIELDLYYSNWTVLLHQKVPDLNKDHVHQPEHVYLEEKTNKRVLSYMEITSNHVLITFQSRSNHVNMIKTSHQRYEK